MKVIVDLFNNKIVKFIYGLLKTIVVIMVVVYIGFLALQRFSNNSSVMGYRVFRVVSPSMVPVYEVNDIVLVKDITLKELKVDDDITYQGTHGEMAGKIVTHRIIKIEESENGVDIQTKGVANEDADPIIHFDQVYGKVVCELVPISIINGFLSNIYGFFFFIFVPFVVIVFVEILDTMNKLKEDNDESKKRTVKKQRSKKSTSKKK